MLETSSTKPRDALLEKLRERIKDRDRALEVKHVHRAYYNILITLVVRLLFLFHFHHLFQFICPKWIMEESELSSVLCFKPPSAVYSGP